MVNDDSAVPPTGRWALRSLRLEAALRVLVASGPVSRTEIAAQTGYSPATVTGIVRDLEERGVVIPAGRSKPTGGRRRALVHLASDRLVLTVLTLQDGLVVASQVDLDGNLQAQTRVRTSGRSPLVAGQRAVEQLHEMAELRSRCLVLAVPGVVSADGEVTLAPSMGPLPTRQVGERLTRVLGLPVIVENDVNLIALGERRRGAAAGEDVVVLHVGDGVGATVLLGGKVFSGAHRSAGEIGFLPWGESAPARGARGPFESRWSTPAIAEEARRRGLSLTDHPLDALQDAATTDERAAGLVAEVIDAWSGAALACACVIDPERIVLSGDATRLWPEHRQALARLVAARTPATTEVHFAVLGHDAVAHGATAALLQRPELLLHSQDGPDPAEQPTTA